jgi:anaerobic selenocysteine-containing dehydrogenase
MAAYFQFDNAEHFIRQWAGAIPGGLDELRKSGIWIDDSQPRKYQPYLQDTGYTLDDPRIQIGQDGLARLLTEGDRVIGRIWNGHIVRGFSTPDRKFQFTIVTKPETTPVTQSQALQEVDGASADYSLNPEYRPVNAHRVLSDDELILTTFKWNVHTQSRTANQQWLTEIVSDNPCWIHPSTAKKHGISNGQPFVISRHKADGESAEIEVKPVITEAIHPRVLAISASFGHWQYGRNAQGKGVNPNPLIPSWTDPLGGGQAWNDTVVSIKH